MTHIRSRKHAVRAGQFGRATAATLATSLALALPAVVRPAFGATVDAAGDAASAPMADGADATQSLPTVQVEGQAVKDYKVDSVSSPKFVKPLVDTTQSIQIISSQLIHDQAATTLTEALRNSPGVGTFYVGENGSTSTGDAIYMRGFDSSGSIFVDGVRDLGTVSRDMFNIQQVEVTKGPASTDYGRTAPTGSINLVTKQPLLEDQLQGTVYGGSADQKRVIADWNQRISALDGAAFRLNVMGQDSGVPGRDEVQNQRWGVAPSLAFGLGTSTRFYVDLLHVKQNNVPDGGVPTIGLSGYSTPDPTRPELGVARRVDSSNFYGTDADHDDSKTDMLTLLLEHDFSDDVKLSNTTRWGRTHQNYLLTSFMGSAANLLTPDISDPSTWTLARSNPTFKDQTNRIVTNQTNLRVHSEGAGGFSNDLSTGVELTREKLATTGLGALNGSAWPPANLYHPNPHVTGMQWGPTGATSDGKTDTEAAYAFDTISFAERWQINAGVRFDHYKTDFSSLVPCGGRGAPVCGDLPTGTIVPGVDAKTSDTLFNWKLG
ncbi:MAG TPA: catecholate siderophore receptor Fiu, partial [Dokdonella sp.]